MGSSKVDPVTLPRGCAREALGVEASVRGSHPDL
jgi:hypothetical protein